MGYLIKNPVDGQNTSELLKYNWEEFLTPSNDFLSFTYEEKRLEIMDAENDQTKIVKALATATNMY